MYNAIVTFRCNDYLPDETVNQGVPIFTLLFPVHQPDDELGQEWLVSTRVRVVYASSTANGVLQQSRNAHITQGSNS